MDDFDIDEFNDICGLADIFPDIEPYLKDVTESFENAKAESGKQKLNATIDSSDSDSGISGDSFATSILKNLEMSISNDLSVKQENIISFDKLDNVKLIDSHVTENPVNIDCKADIPKLTLKVPTTVRICNDRTVLNIFQKSTDTKPKHIIIKSHQSLTKLNNNFKRDSECIIPNVTKVKILKPNQNYPILVNKSNSMNIQSYTIKNDSSHFNDYPKINLKEIKKSDNIISKTICNNEYISNDLSMNTSFLPESQNKNINTDFQNGFYGRKPLSLDISSIDDFKSMDSSDAYYDMFQSSPTTDENTLSPTYNSFNNNGSINPQQFDRIIKKQERMIKNRQAASLSRQRKKEYVERLEHKVELQKHENQHLQNQVNEIKERFCSLEQENLIMKRDLQMWRDRYYDLERQKMKQGIPVNKYSNLKVNDLSNKGRVVKTTAATTTILGIFILLTFNFNSLIEINQKVAITPTLQQDSNIALFNNNNNLETSLLKKKIIGTENRIGRTLFSIIENASLPDDILKKDIYNQLCNNSIEVNLTETTRLTLELNKWGSRYKAESVKEYDRIQNEKIKSQILNKEINSIYKKSKLRYYQIPNDKFKGKHAMNTAELELYHKNNGFDFLDSIFDDIDRKSDTLYFVSFHSDNLIYPATTNSKNFSTPKITLLLPADVKQGDETHYKMMKIDCHVHNFTVVNLKKMKQP